MVRKQTVFFVADAARLMKVVGQVTRNGVRFVPFTGEDTSSTDCNDCDFNSCENCEADGGETASSNAEVVFERIRDLVNGPGVKASITRQLNNGQDVVVVLGEHLSAEDAEELYELFDR